MKSQRHSESKADVELRGAPFGEIRKELFQAQFRGPARSEVEERGRFRKLRREVARIETMHASERRKLGIRGAKRR